MTADTTGIQRCTFRWTPEPINGFCYPEFQCTHRGDVEHGHGWSSYEADLWARQEMAVGCVEVVEGTDDRVRRHDKHPDGESS